MRLLVVEDDLELLSVLTQSLREQGYAVDTAADGREGLFKASGGYYDAIILDVMLPQMDGWSMLKQLRMDGNVAPVLMLTARDEPSDRVKGLDLGADDYLSKPFQLKELYARLRAIIRRSSGKAHSVIEVGDVRIDTAARTVFKANQEVNLTMREYTLVELLAMRLGKLVSRKAIYEHLFDEADDSLSNLVDVHVSNVRKKLGKDFISTRRGQGYIISAETRAYSGPSHEHDNFT
jgi:two-component system OmpR family response regulator